MSQQHAQFEEEFRDGARVYAPHQGSYEETPSVSYTVPVPPPVQQPYMSMPGQKLQAPVQNTRQAGSGIGARVFLAIVSMILVMAMFLVALVISRLYDPVNNITGVLSVLFAFVFAVIVIIINLIVNIRR